MAVAKWSWETANLSPSETGSAYAMSGATADEVKKAYSTLITKGAVSDFSYKVWNDMCLKLKDLITEWDTGVTLEDVWVNSPYQSDYPDEETFKQNNGGVIMASALNRVIAALPDFAEKPWNQKLKAGDPCKASYFLSMVEVLNRWCGLTPEEFSTIMEILFKESGNVQFGNTEAIYPEKLDALLKSAAEIYVFNTIFTKIMLKIIATFPDIAIETHEPTLIHPNKNEIQFKTSCIVIDKNYVAAESEKLEFLFQITANAVMRNAILTGITDSFKMTGTVNARSPEISDEAKIRLLIRYGSSVKAVQTSTVYILISDKYKHKNRITAETHEPVQISIRERFSHSGMVTVGFENGFNLEMEDTEIKFKDDFNEIRVSGNSFEYEGAFKIQAPLINIQESHGTDFSSQREIQITGDIDSIAGMAKIIECSDELGLKGESEVDSAPPQDMQYSGNFETDEIIELSFGNEKELEVLNETINFENDSIELLSENSLPIEHSGNFVTEENIALGETSAKKITGEQRIKTDSIAEISKSMTLKKEADAVIRMLSTADIEGILNKNLEAETISEISSIASLAMQRMSGLASKISVETLQEALIDAVVRKVLGGQASTFTKQTGDVIIKKMKHLSGLENSASVRNEGIIDKASPKIVEAKENTTTLQSAFLDTSYTKGGTLTSDSSVEVLQEALISFADRKILDANTIFSTITYADNEKVESKQIEGNPIACSDSEATMVLARISLVLAEEYKEKLVTEIDDISAEEMERTLLFA